MSHTVLHRTQGDIEGCLVEGLAPLPPAGGLLAAPRRAAGSLESFAIAAPAPFDDLVASWNADLPDGASLAMTARVRVSGDWSPWFLLGTATGSAASPSGALASPPAQEGPFGRVEVDTLRLSSAAEAFQYRVDLESGNKPAVLKLAAVTVTDGNAPREPPLFRDGPWVRELAVRPRSQFQEPAALQWDICSPTSLAMALEFHGVRRRTLEVARRVQDGSTGIYGDWPFNTAAAGGYGLEAFVTRLDSIDGLQAEVAAGRPVVVSLTYGAGEMSGAPLASTKGHLVVVSGFTAGGDVVVMDPAAPYAASVRRVYRRGEFHRAWRVNKRGMAYLLGEPLGRGMTVGVPSTDLRSRPKPAKRPDPDDPDRLSQLLEGEGVTPLEVKGEWVLVQADEQENKGRAYRGWVRVRDLLYREPLSADGVVSSWRTTLSSAQGGRVLSVGTRLAVLDRRGDRSLVRLLDGRTGRLPSADIGPLGAGTRSGAGIRASVLETAKRLIGKDYVWGGRSGVGAVPGVDCSGLAGLCYRLAGVELPRDAADQRLRSSPKEPSSLKPGDLVFLTSSARSKKVTHVMLYAGGDSLIEARQSAGKVLRTTFTERFGEPLRSLKDGAAVTDLTGRKPSRRAVYFGAILP